MKKGQSIKKLVLNSLFIALVFLTTYFTRIPTPLPGGYFNTGDAVIMLASILLGPISGMTAGAVGSALADLAAGAVLFIPITFVVKGIEGLVTGILAARFAAARGTLSGINARAHLIIMLPIVAGATVMVAGYFLAEAFLLGAFDEAFGLAAAVAELLPNTIQGVASMIVAYLLVLFFTRVNIEKYIR